MARKTTYDFERKLLDRSLPKSEEDKKLLADNEITEQDLQELNYFLDSVSKWSDEGDVKPSPSVKAELLSSFDQKRKRTSVVWLNSFALWLFPKDRPVFNTPGVRLALVSACVVLIVAVVNMSGNVSEDKNVAQEMPEEKSDLPVNKPVKKDTENTAVYTDEMSKSEEKVLSVDIEALKEDEEARWYSEPGEESSKEKALEKSETDEVSVVTNGSGAGAEVLRDISLKDYDGKVVTEDYMKSVPTVDATTINSSFAGNTSDSLTVQTFSLAPAPPDGYFLGNVQETTVKKSETTSITSQSDDAMLDKNEDLFRESEEKSEELVATESVKRKAGKYEKNNKERMNTATKVEGDSSGRLALKSVNLANQGSDLIGLLYTAK